MTEACDSPRDLLRQYAAVLDRLHATGIVRSKNNPVADYAEWLVVRALKLSLTPQSTKGFDATDSDGLGYKIKARRLTADNGSRRLSAIRGLDAQHFDWLIGVLFDHDFGVVRAAKIPWEVVNRLSTHNDHTNSAVFHLRDQVWEEPSVTDITGMIVAVEPEAD